MGHFSNDISTKQVDQGAALRRSENNSRYTECCGDVDNRVCSGRTNGISKDRLLVDGFLFCFCEDCACFTVLLPFAFCVLLGHKRLFTDEQKIKTPAGFACLAQSKVDGATAPANSTQDCFLASRCRSCFPGR